MKRFASSRKTRRAFTLIELVCVLSVSAIVIVALTGVLSNSLVIMKQLETADADYLGGSFTMDYIESEVRAAEEVIDVADAPLDTRLGSSIGFVLKMQSDKSITYALFGGNLRRYTTGIPERFQDKLYVTGNNLLEENIASATSSIDAENGVLTVRLSIQNGDAPMEFLRLIEIPKQEVSP